LICKAIKILSLNYSSKENVERGDFGALFHFVVFLDPLIVLIYYRVNNVNKGFVTIEKAVTARENIAFHLSFTSIFAKHSYHVACEYKVSSILVVLKIFAYLDLFTCFIDFAKLVRFCLVRTEDSEVSYIIRDYITKEFCYITYTWEVRNSRLNIGKLVFSEVRHIKRFSKETPMANVIGAHVSISSRS
jgi:hypothetical protein